MLAVCFQDREWMAMANLPARVGVGSPCTTDTIQLVVKSEVIETQSMFQTIGHGDTRRPSADDDGIQSMRILRHDEGEDPSKTELRMKC